MRACAFDELLPDPSRLRTRIDDEYKPACLAEDVGGGYMGNMQLRFLLDHERDEIISIADDEAGIGAIENTSVSLFLSANQREEHSRCGWDHPSVIIA